MLASCSERKARHDRLARNCKELARLSRCAAGASIAITLAEAARHIRAAVRLLVRETSPVQERWILSQVDCELLMSERPLRLAREAVALLGEHAEVYWV